jgi:hypothetical protein
LKVVVVEMEKEKSRRNVVMVKDCLQLVSKLAREKGIKCTYIHCMATGKYYLLKKKLHPEKERN